jgi:hypothetical protein
MHEVMEPREGRPSWQVARFLARLLRGGRYDRNAIAQEINRLRVLIGRDCGRCGEVKPLRGDCPRCGPEA